MALCALFGVAAAMRAPDAMAQSTAAGAGAREYHTRFRSDAGDGIRAVEIDGRIRFSADDSRIEWMADDAYLLIVAGDNGRNIRLRAEPDRHGRPSYRFDIDGRTKRSGNDSERWLADTLPVVFRELGFDAEARVRTAYEQGGADAVFLTLAAIRSDYSAIQHYVAFFGRKNLTDEEIIGALSRMGTDIETDDELAKIFYGVADFYRERPAVRTSFLACLGQIDSELVRTRVTRDLFGTDTVADNTTPTMLESAGNC